MPFHKWSSRLFLVLAALFILLRFVHLTADYPHNIRWDDGIATDEGWYASAAVDQQTWHTPLLAGDMNIGVLMPVWPRIAQAAFSIAGYSATSIRATAVLFFIVCVTLCALLLRRYGARAYIPLLALILAINPWAFAFSRSAFLELPMVTLLLACALCIPRTKHDQPDTNLLIRLLAAGVFFALAVLLKSTALALTPAILYLIAEGANFRLRPTTLRSIGLFAIAACIYAPYWLLVIRTHPTDVTFYLSVVGNTLRLTPFGFIADVSRPFRYGAGSDHFLFAFTLLLIAASIFFKKVRSLWRDPLFAFAAIWTIFFLGFMVKHNNDPARYFAVFIPMLALITIALLRNPGILTPTTRKLFLTILFADILLNAAQISATVLHPTYTFHNAATSIAAIVNAEPGHNTVVIGDNAHELSLQSGLRPVNLLFHADTITEQMQRYNPGWWVQFSPIEDGRCFREVLSIAYTADPRGEWPIFNANAHQRFILYKLTPIPGAALPTTLTPEQTAACHPPVYN